MENDLDVFDELSCPWVLYAEALEFGGPIDEGKGHVTLDVNSV
jgi:hypothetical protein